MSQLRFEAFAIVSEDGMLATAELVMPPCLKYDADKRFFEDALDRVDVVVHGRHSHEGQPHSDRRKRIILTRQLPAIAQHANNPRAILWNPAGAPIEAALDAVGAPHGQVAVLGGPEAFALFLDRYDAFYLSRAARARIPGGRPVFPEVPSRTPEDVLASHGLRPEPPVALDEGLSLVTWTRANGSTSVA